MQRLNFSLIEPPTSPVCLFTDHNAFVLFSWLCIVFSAEILLTNFLYRYWSIANKGMRIKIDPNHFLDCDRVEYEN